ncbi:MAG TPA: hypothetical protein VFN23_08090 [Ktedonobacteraceae bacterium]|nr:hypothetical protein [Ktedonobacteraceae bacterium]
MSTKSTYILLAIVGFIGIVLLSASFAINPGPPAGISNAQLIAWGAQNEKLIQAGAWSQIVGSFLQVVFILGILYITGAIRRFVGLIVAVAAVLIMGVSLVESSFYLSAIASGLSGDFEGLHVSLNLILSIQHAYSIIPAPALDGGLGVVLLTSALFKGLFGRILGYLGLAFGVILLILGFFGTFTPLQGMIDNVLMAQQVWLLAVSIAIIIGARHVQNSPVVSQTEAIAS